MNFAQPPEYFDVFQSGLFADFAFGGLLGRLAFFDVAFRDGPAVFGILNQQDFDLAVFTMTKNNTARRRFADNFLDRRFVPVKVLLEFIELWSWHSMLPQTPQREF